MSNNIVTVYKQPDYMNTTYALDLLSRFEQASDERTIVALLRQLSVQAGFDYFRLALLFPSSIQRPDVIIFNIAHQIANIFYFTLTYPPFFILNRAKYNPEQ